MPIPKAVTRVNRRIINPVMRRIAGHIPPLAIVTHRGRRSGEHYRTPVLAFPTHQEFVIALTYGPGTDWEQNVMATGGCMLTYRGHDHPLTDPVEFESSTPPEPIPEIIRAALRLLRVTTFVRMRRSD